MGRMISGVRLAVLAGGLLMTGLGRPVLAQDSGAPVQGRADGQISREYSKLLVSVPGLVSAEEFYQHHILGAGGYVSYYAAVWSRNGIYPRMQVSYDTAGTGRSYTSHPAMDETWVRRLMPFFNGRVISVRGTGEAAVHHAHTISFTVDRSDCVAFHYFVGDDGASALTKAPSIVYGFYCSAPGARLDASDIEEALRGISLRS